MSRPPSAADTEAIVGSVTVSIPAQPFSLEEVRRNLAAWLLVVKPALLRVVADCLHAELTNRGCEVGQAWSASLALHLEHCAIGRLGRCRQRGHQRED